MAHDWREAYGRQIGGIGDLEAERRGRFVLIDQFGAFDVTALALSRTLREPGS